jgi:hypothetical protein
MLAPETALILSPPNWSACPEGKTVVLYDTLLSLTRPSPTAAGAEVVTLNCLPESAERKFVNEGQLRRWRNCESC